MFSTLARGRATLTEGYRMVPQKSFSENFDPISKFWKSLWRVSKSRLMPLGISIFFLILVIYYFFVANRPRNLGFVVFFFFFSVWSSGVEFFIVHGCSLSNWTSGLKTVKQDKAGYIGGLPPGSVGVPDSRAQSLEFTILYFFTAADSLTHHDDER